MVSLAFSTVGLYKPHFNKYSFYYISHPSYTVCVTSLETSCTGLVVQASDIEDIFHTWHTCMTWCILAPLHVQRDCLDSDANVVSYLHSVQCNRTFEASLKANLFNSTSFNCVYNNSWKIWIVNFPFMQLYLISLQFHLRATRLLNVLFSLIFFFFSMTDKVLHLCRHAEVKNWSSALHDFKCCIPSPFVQHSVWEQSVKYKARIKSYINPLPSLSLSLSDSPRLAFISIVWAASNWETLLETFALTFCHQMKYSIWCTAWWSTDFPNDAVYLSAGFSIKWCVKYWESQAFISFCICVLASWNCLHAVTDFKLSSNISKLL